MERVIDAAARAAFVSWNDADPRTWDLLSEAKRVGWRKVVLAAAEVIDEHMFSYDDNAQAALERRIDPRSADMKPDE